MPQQMPQAVLAERAGLYREAPPIAALQAHFRCTWLHSVDKQQTGPVAVVPDGCVDLIWQGDSLIAVGPDLVTAHHQLTPGSTLIGLRFEAGAARHWLGLPMSEIVGRGVPLRDLWGQAAEEIADRLRGAGTIAARVTLLQDCLARRQAAIAAPAKVAGFLFKALQQRDGGGIDRVLAQLTISGRNLRRLGHTHFGYGPKTLERILRFQTFLAEARQFPAMSLAILAATAGYADQAHLSREVRDLAGMTPTALMRQLRG